MANPCPPTTLFLSPKQGGILQSSGFLDLKSLMALSRTCKANVLDELSLILLIENEITRYHGVHTMKEAIAFWRNVRSCFYLIPWLERDRSAAESSIEVTREMLSNAITYEVMLSKMLRAVPTQSERLQLVGADYRFGMTMLHIAAWSNDFQFFKPTLSVYPGTERCNIDVSTRRAALPYVTSKFETMETILAVYPESERLQAVRFKDRRAQTVLHHAVSSNNPESLPIALLFYPESERPRALLRIKDEGGSTVLHRAAQYGNCEAIEHILAHCPKSEILWVLSMQDTHGRTALHGAAYTGNLKCLKLILSHYPESERLQALNRTTHDGETVVHCAALSNAIECIKAVLSLFPESEHWKVVNVQDREGKTVLDYMREETHNAIMEWLPQPEQPVPTLCFRNSIF